MAEARVTQWALDAVAALARRLPPVRGRGALGHRLRVAVGARARGVWQVPLRGGALVEMPRPSAQGWGAAFTGQYESAAAQLADALFLPRTFALDVGASLGIFAVLLGAMARGRAGEVVAFEPAESNLRWLRHNVMLNGLEALVHVHPVGLAEASGTAQMRMEHGQAGNAVVMRGAVEQGEHVLEGARLARLDDLELAPEQRGMRCSFIKMDVEGFELYALRGAEGFMARHRPALFGEFNAKFMRDFGLGPEDIRGWAGSHGYIIYRMDRMRPVPFTDAQRPRLRRPEPDDQGAWMDLVLVPAERADAVPFATPST
jgi:FkbM family methyltransferase